MAYMAKPSESLSWYRATARPYSAYPKLDGDSTADVCIIGAGYTGLSAALELARAGRRVIVLEAETVGYGGSGRNGGQICTGFSPGQGVVAAQVGRDDARKCFRLAEEAKGLIEDRIRVHAIECDLNWGYLHCATKESKLRHLQEMQEEWVNEGYRDLQLLTKAELEEKLGTRAYFGALRESRAGHFHPLDYCNGLARAAAQAGARIHEQTRVTRCDAEGEPRAWTATGVVTAKYMIVACNAYIDRLVSKLYHAMMPVTSFVVATEKLGNERARALIRDNEAVADTNWVLDYFRRTADDRLLFGGRAAYSNLEPSDLAASIKARLERIFPQLVGCRHRICLGRLHRHHLQPPSRYGTHRQVNLLRARLFGTGRGARQPLWQAHGGSDPRTVGALRSAEPFPASAFSGRSPAAADPGRRHGMVPTSRRAGVIPCSFDTSHRGEGSVRGGNLHVAEPSSHSARMARSPSPCSAASPLRFPLPCGARVFFLDPLPIGERAG